ncbi:MAG TPA: sulfite exporter TauE/SafE family protein [Chthonomonadales bacterium]|nr:sulfite exporter TauE/SafE family protein [Chthonomonadales bacterium]
MPLGFALGAYGTLIGAGGGFILTPILLLLYPHESPERLTSISLAVIFFNALSGSGAYARMKRIDYRSGLLFSVATIPGAVLGALTTNYLPRRVFDAIFGVLLLGTCVFLLVHPNDKKECNETSRNGVTQTIVEADGTRHVYSYNPIIGFVLSLFVGYVSSLLGIGGGIIHVPALVHLLHFPVHIATATSHFILAIMSLTGTCVHIVNGAFHQGLRRTIMLSVGVVLGAQLGARLSNRVYGEWIIRGLAIALGFVGLRILVMAFY